MDLLQQFPAVFAAAAGLIGLLVGSFLNVVIHRLPKMMEAEWRAQCAELSGIAESTEPKFNLWTPRSRCPSCSRQIKAIENVPLFSWLALRGRCAGCKTSISMRYPAVELLGGALAAATAWKFGFGAQALLGCVLVWALIALTFIDADTQLLPDDITLPLLWLGLLANMWNVFTSLESAVIGAVAGYLTLWSVYWLFKLTTGKEGMGYGDFKLLGALGAWFGWTMLPALVLLSSVVGAAVGVVLIVFGRHQRENPMPFGPYIAGAGVLALFMGDSLRTLILP
ncbi:MAG TPA: A24 family peptidase [Burkholderiaceae bacterium]|nr:A24 family peptidase [Burkholderiaceae bacterium]